VELEYEVISVSAIIPVAKLSVKPIEFTQSPDTKVVLLLSGPWVKERVFTFVPWYWAPDQREKAVFRADVNAVSSASVPAPVYTTEFDGFKLQEMCSVGQVTLSTSLGVTGRS
jgi:hypothetical protein